MKYPVIIEFKGSEECVEGVKRWFSVRLEKNFLNEFGYQPQDCTPVVCGLNLSADWGENIGSSNGNIRGVTYFLKSIEGEDKLISDVKEQVRDAVEWFNTKKVRQKRQVIVEVKETGDTVTIEK